MKRQSTDKLVTRIELETYLLNTILFLKNNSGKFYFTNTKLKCICNKLHGFPVYNNASSEKLFRDMKKKVCERFQQGPKENTYSFNERNSVSFITKILFYIK